MDKQSFSQSDSLCLSLKHDTVHDRALRMPEVRYRVQYATSTIYRLIAQGKFPPPIKLNPNGTASFWLESTIDRWIAERAGAHSCAMESSHG